MSRVKLIERLQAEKTVIEAGQDVVVELFKPSDALGVSLAYFEVYGDSFPIEHVYDPEEIIKRNATEDQYTVVARTPKGEIVGLAGLFRHAPNKDIYEAGQLMVLKSYRSADVGKKISSKILGNFSVNLGIDVVFVEAVCNHPISQQLAYNEGFRPTGIELECMPAKVYSTEGKVSRNVSLLLMFSIYKDRSQQVYLPEIYAKYINGLYSSLGLVRREGTKADLDGETVFKEFLLPDAKFGRITIEKAGTDLSQVLNDFENKVGVGGVSQAYINLGDKAVGEAVTLFRKKGYMFGGVLPLWFGSDGMIMQKLPGEPDWSQIQLHDEGARDLLEYLRADYSKLNFI